MTLLYAHLTDDQDYYGGGRSEYPVARFLTRNAARCLSWLQENWGEDIPLYKYPPELQRAAEDLAQLEFITLGTLTGEKYERTGRAPELPELVLARQPSWALASLPEGLSPGVGPLLKARLADVTLGVLCVKPEALAWAEEKNRALAKREPREEFLRRGLLERKTTSCRVARPAKNYWRVRVWELPE